MKQVARSVFAIVAGLVSGFVFIYLVEMMNTALFDLPSPGSAYALDEVPASAFVAVLIGWFVGTAMASYVACKLCGERPSIHAGIIGAFALAGGLFNLASAPHPAWMWPCAILAFIGGAWTGARWSRTGTDSPLGDIAIG